MRIVSVMIVAGIVLGTFAAFMVIAPSIPASSSSKDRINDAVAVRIHETNVDPLVQPYHDIVSASVKRLNSNELLLTAELAGDANFNTTYETVYVWVIDHPSLTGNKRYTVIVPHLPPEFGLSTGWHIAIFDNNAEKYVLPLESIDQMPANKVEVKIDPALIGNPPFFWWQTFAMVRVEPEFDRPPDFLMDSVPDNSTVLLWF